MKYILGIFFCLAISSQSQAQALSNANDSLSYALGQDLGSYIKRMDLPINKAKLLQAIGDVLEGKDPLFKDEDREQIIRDGLQKIQDEKSAGLKKSAEEFLTKNKSKAGVKVTPEGEQYEVLKEGTGWTTPLPKQLKAHNIEKGNTAENVD